MGGVTGDFADPATPEGARLTALPFREGEPLGDIIDSVEPNGVLASLKISLFGIPASAHAYRNILGTLGVGGYRDEELGMAAISSTRLCGSVSGGGLPRRRLTKSAAFTDNVLYYLLEAPRR